MIFMEAVKKDNTEIEDQDKDIEKKVKEIEPKPVKEGLTYMEAGYQICIENQRNFNNLMMAVGLDELSYLVNEKKEMVYTESSIQGFFAKVAAIVENIWAKIKGLWRNLTTAMAGVIRNDENFINKYGSTMEEGSKMVGPKVDGEKHTGYKFNKELNFKAAESSILGFVGGTGLSESAVLTEADEKAAEEPKKEDNTAKKEKKYKPPKGEADDGYVSTLRKAICPGATGYANTFSDECLKHLRGESVENIYTAYSFAEVKSEILGFKNNLDNKHTAYKLTENIFSAELKKIKAKHNASNSESMDKNISNVVRTITEANNVIALANSATISSVKARYHQAKAIARKWIVAAKGKNDSNPNKIAADESAITPGNLLENLTII